MQTQSQSRSPLSSSPDTSAPLPQPLRKQVAALAEQHGFALEAGQALWNAISLGRGGMAQFSHADFGGSGQWMRGGMLMIEDMFNDALKARVGALSRDLAALYHNHPEWHSDEGSGAMSSEWWPEGLHSPSTSGAQNGIAYAYFPAQRRLAVRRNGKVEVYDTAEHLIGSAAQQQGGAESLTFASQIGTVDIAALRKIGDDRPGEPVAVDPRPAAAPTDRATLEAQASSRSGPSLDLGRDPPPYVERAFDSRTGTSTPDETLAILEKHAALHASGVLTEAEFSAKKAELLARL